MENPLDKEKKEEEKKMEIHKHHGGGWPDSKIINIKKNKTPKSEIEATEEQHSEIQQWTVQHHQIATQK